ncbi:hypothetical protein Rxyl_0668 [Rubrobacter xylanophilus DSM 9941]|uniref:Uncharacterized protein n=1 Tax=Rubrobacter xylanophilus (strain DSM 9941 / JCM 11954 / NBRC 16129 / PRD-1) TaxID=266117 RepID=Q1AY90_RUBXD|nr:hypothetical protein [Rubrobacter xylanophilus]ABG03638.1 hypothetical protein Rxyl_0668 [Rubrobacter xylanophilus DSM 9941]
MDQERKTGGRLLAGRMLCVIGILIAPFGAYAISVVLDAVALILGTIGFALGARTLGAATVVLAVVAMFVGLLAGEGMVPGAYDRALEDVFGGAE